jgi:3-deoxy-D-manno-octulosonic-acid transferase
MILLYRIVAYLVYLVLYPYGRIRAARGDGLWRGRLGLDKLEGADIWVHAASVGEVKVVSYLADFILRARPGVRIHLTVMTRAGYETARSSFGERLSVSFFPLDVRFLQKSALSYLRPKAIVTAETELWPNLILAAERAGTPMILVNGRMSRKAHKRYLWFKSTFRHLLGTYDRFFFKTDDDAQRYREFGVSADRCAVSGDMKFDAPLRPRDGALIHDVRRKLGVSDDAFVLVAGSTRPGEEAMLLEAYRSLKVAHAKLRLVIAPRHLDRVSEILDLCSMKEVAAFKFNTNGGQANRSGNDSVVIVDQMGILNDLYLAADLAFVGGTLVNVGGHNILEPVWAGTPVLFGPSIQNVRDAAEYVLANSYGAQIDNVEQLAGLIGDVIAGRRTFSVKTDTDMQKSATAVAGSYILERISHD